MIEMINRMYADDPIATILLGLLIIITLLSPLIMRPFLKKWDEKFLKECAEFDQKIWDGDSTEDKRYAWAYADSVARWAAQRNRRKKSAHSRHRKAYRISSRYK